ncbi:hypothetical protein B0G69_5362 [Paraburkholderia sp. RAU2J]|uniref:hypothetical protein n=1 Tax=Paraburkholderia sp. RAU2J TaxID=1938810 RepID=UPI000EB56306|nr:hypothetical protein [Paraburkholderia sp. RAU2J]RKT21947.1 hypothetical protein B0G69_5362 [Paraburkholderia sp. RAU2J]
MANDSDFPQSEAEGQDRRFDIRGAHRTSAPPPGFGRFALCIAAAGALAFGVLATVAYSVWFNHDQQAYAEAIASARQALGMQVSSSAVALGAAVSGPMKPVALMEPAVSAAAPGAAATHTIMTAPATTEAIGSAAPALATTAPTSNAPATRTPSGSETIASEPSRSRASPVSDGEQGSQQAVWSGQVAPAAAEAGPRTVVLADATPRTSPSPSPRPIRRINKSADPAVQQSAAARSGKQARTAQAEHRASAPNAKHKDSLFARMGQFFRRVDYRQHDAGRQQQDLYSRP